MNQNLIGKVLGEKISEKGFNYSTFAEKVGFSQAYISKIVNGNTQKMSLETLEKLLSPLDMTLQQLLAEVEKKRVHPCHNARVRVKPAHFDELRAGKTVLFAGYCPKCQAPFTVTVSLSR